MDFGPQCSCILSEGNWKVSWPKELQFLPPVCFQVKYGCSPLWWHIYFFMQCLWLSSKKHPYLCLQLLAKALRDRKLQSKLAKHHNRKCEGQGDRASSLSLHRQQSAAALLTPENWSSSSSDAKTFKPRPLYRTEKSTGLFTFLTESYGPLSTCTKKCLSLSVERSHCSFSTKKTNSFSAHSDFYMSLFIKMSGPVPPVTYIETFHRPPPDFVKFKIPPLR